MDASGWEFLGPIPGMPDQWSIDATVFILGQRLYCCWSGWAVGKDPDTQQDLFLARMESPERAEAGTTICISEASLPWERPDDGRRGVNEGPTFLQAPGFHGIVYSAHGSGTSEYKLALLALTGTDPLDPRSWAKRQTPLLVSDRAMGLPYGPGHASFLPEDAAAPASGETGGTYCIYHATENWDDGWQNRKARVLRLSAECFESDAKPICCAYAAQGPMGTVEGSGVGRGKEPSAFLRRAWDKTKQLIG